jgi:hypothetical protein
MLTNSGIASGVAGRAKPRKCPKWTTNVPDTVNVRALV